MLDISFSPREHWDGGRDVVIFWATTSAKNIPCAISLEAFQDHLNGDPRQPLETFRQHRATVEELARRLICNQRFEPDGSILIRSHDW